MTTEKTKFYFRVSMSVCRNSYDGKMYAQATIHLYRSSPYGDPDVIRQSDKFASISFQAAPIDDQNKDEPKAKLQPRYFHNVYVEDDYQGFYQTDIDIHRCYHIEEIAEYSKHLHTIAKKAGDCIEKFNLRYVYGSCCFSLYAYALLNAGIAQVCESGNGDLHLTGDKKSVWTA